MKRTTACCLSFLSVMLLAVVGFAQEPCPPDITAVGCCDGLELKFCASNTLMTITCADSCGWSQGSALLSGWYDCQESGVDPTGTYPLECSPPPCVPECTGKACGDDGCGSFCGDCAEGESCEEGICASEPDSGEVTFEHGDLNCDWNLDVVDVVLSINIALGLDLSEELDGDGNGIPDACPAPVVEVSCGVGTLLDAAGETCVGVITQVDVDAAFIEGSAQGYSQGFDDGSNATPEWSPSCFMMGLCGEWGAAPDGTDGPYAAYTEEDAIIMGNECLNLFYIGVDMYPSMSCPSLPINCVAEPICEEPIY